jgi:hypothetical protein
MTPCGVPGLWTMTDLYIGGPAEASFQTDLPSAIGQTKPRKRNQNDVYRLLRA